jgi:hypothetical protein
MELFAISECGASCTGFCCGLRLGRSQGGGAPPPQQFLRSVQQLLGGRGPLGLPEESNRPKNGSLWAAGGSEISLVKTSR